MAPPDELRPGLWRWSAPHPEWEATGEDGTPTVWPREVGCVLYTSAAGAVVIDPLAPTQDTAEFWRWADERCDGREVSVLETIGYHRRSREQVIARYGALTSAPATVEAHPLAGFEETVYWIPEHRALVPGDALITVPDGELRLCPQSWLDELGSSDERTLAGLRAALLPLCDLEVELVLVSHGEPTLRDGGAALRRALHAT
jgi:glyoxylase-like metal-dependent hydrolase (beta-lactamase superfamily II)